MMFLEILLFALIGIAAGTFTGLVPGIHTNTLCALILGITPSLIGFGLHPHGIIVLIISMVVTHTVIDFIPSIFLGAPDDATALSVLPGHRMVLDGKGLEAVYLTVIGGVGVVFLYILLLPLLLKIIPIFYSWIKSYIHFVLSGIAFLMIAIERKIKKLFSLFIFLLSGTFGFLILNNSFLPSTYVFFPIFTGMFGISTLLISLNKKAKIPKQKKDIEKIDKKIAVFGTIKAFFSGLLVGILPGIGSAQATILSQQLTRSTNEMHNTKEFLVCIGGINTANALFALTSLYSIGKPRSGAAITIQKILETFGMNELLLLIASSLIAVGVASILTLKISKKIALLLEKCPYHKLSLFIIIFFLILTIYFTGFVGLLILFTSTAIGLLPPLLGTKRSICMGVIMLPVILYYFGF